MGLWFRSTSLTHTLKLHLHGHFPPNELMEHGYHVNQVKGGLDFIQFYFQLRLNSDNPSSLFVPFKRCAAQNFTNFQVTEKEWEENCGPHFCRRVKCSQIRTTIIHLIFSQLTTFFSAEPLRKVKCFWWSHILYLHFRNNRNKAAWSPATRTDELFISIWFWRLKSDVRWLPHLRLFAKTKDKIGHRGRNFRFRKWWVCRRIHSFFVKLLYLVFQWAVYSNRKQRYVV